MTSVASIREALEALPRWDKRSVPGGFHVRLSDVLAALPSDGVIVSEARLRALEAVAEAAEALLTGSGDDDPLPDDEWDPVFLELRTRLAALRKESEDA